MYIFRELCANKLPQHAVRRDQGGIQRRESRKPCPQRIKLAALGGGQVLVRGHGVQQGVPQADFIGVVLSIFLSRKVKMEFLRWFSEEPLWYFYLCFCS